MAADKFLLGIFFFSLIASWHCATLPPDAMALLSFKSSADPLGTILTFRRTSGHCRWHGVECSAGSGGRVLRLVLENLGLNGTFAAGTIARLDQLRVLSLKSNSLHGPLPSDLANLTNLKALYLAGNLFSGDIPPSIVYLHRLRTLDLSHNNLSGPIDSGFAAMDRLSYFRLDSNRLSGSLPPFNQSTLIVFNVSGNNLSGPVPVTAVLTEFGISAFVGNPWLCGVAVRRECRSNFQFFHARPASIAPSPANAVGAREQIPRFITSGISSPSSRSMNKRTVVAIGFLCSLLLLVGLLGCFLFSIRKRNVNQMQKLASTKSNSDVFAEKHNLENGDGNTRTTMDNYNTHLSVTEAAPLSDDKVRKLGQSGSLVFCAGEVHAYTLEHLMRASAEMLGRGTVGTTYKAVLDNQLILTVKRLDATRLGVMGRESFDRHLDIVGRLRHPNIVPLRAYFHAKEERLLVYDYQPNGSLFALLHGSRSTRAKPLHWTSCLKIAEDVVKGLSYIHQASRLVHGNIKSSNILLGSDFEACLADNCLSFLMDPPSDASADLCGYEAPEFGKSNHNVTPKSDIYAFGVVLLELLTGKPPLQHPALSTIDLTLWVRSLRGEGAEDERLMMLLDIAAACVRTSPESRPGAWQVLKMIQEVKEVEVAAATTDDGMDSSSLS